MRWILALACVAGLGLSTQALASTEITATYAGTVASGIDQGGIFGPAGADLTGKTFTAVFSEVGSGFQTFGVAPFGSFVGVASSVSLTIGSASFTDSDPYDGDLQDFVGLTPSLKPIVLLTFALAQGVPRSGYLLMVGSFSSIPPASYTYDGVTFAGAFNGPSCCAANQFIDGDDTIGFNTATFSVVGSPSLGLLVTSAIPEPATWTVMLLGLGGLGLALRAERRFRQTLG